MQNNQKYRKTVFGFPMLINFENNLYYIEIPELGIKEKSENKGRAIRNVYGKVSEKYSKGEFSETLINSEQLTEPKGEILRVIKINQKISRYGFCVIADDINIKDLENLEKSLSTINFTHSNTIEEKKKIESLIAQNINPLVMNPYHRALNMCSLIKKTEHLKKFSHIIEQGYLSFFRGEHISTVMTLTPVIEGILLSLFGFDLSERKPEESKLLNKWAELEYKYDIPQMTSPMVIDEYIRSFLDIWDTLFKIHNEAEENLFFNRHYIAHLMGEGNFYSTNNAIKLIILIDLLAHVIASCNGQHYRFTFDTSDEEFLTRYKYYQRIALRGRGDMGYFKSMITHGNFKVN